MRTCLLVVASLVCAAPTGLAQSARIDSAAWLRGCWQMTMGDRVTEEQWMAPAAKTMLGVSRTVRGSSLVEYEFVVLREQGERLEYHAQPAGQPAASFLSREVTDARLVFENPEHDFPRRIGYERQGPDSLLAWIEGPSGGQTRRREFPYRRTSCPAR
jgi:hypothetical protein